MSDFLTHILNKTMDRAPLLQRRRASLFEPTHDTGGGAMLRGASLPRYTSDSDRELPGDTQMHVPAMAHATPRATPMPSFTMPSFTMPSSQPGIGAPFDSRETALEFAPSVSTATCEPGRERQAPPVTRFFPEPRTAAPTQVNDTPKTFTAKPPQAFETIVEKTLAAPRPGLNFPDWTIVGTTEHPAPATQQTTAFLSSQRNKTAESVHGQKHQAPPVARPLPKLPTAALPQVNDTPETFTAQPHPALETILAKILATQRQGLHFPAMPAEGSKKYTATEHPAPATRQTAEVLRGQREKTVGIDIHHPSAKKRTSEATRAKQVDPPVVHLPPTINVTIGRIEVRATPAPATPAREPRRAAPMLSLDDYLRSRSGEIK